MDDTENQEEENADDMENPAVPGDLLDLHVQLEEANTTAEEFGKVFN